MEEVNSTNSSIFTPDELDVLNRTKKTRLDIVTSMTKEGAPSKVGEIRVLNETLNSLDKAVYDSATTRLKYREGQDREAEMELLYGIMEAITTGKVPIHTDVTDMMPVTTSIGDEFIPTDIVPGEADIHPDTLDPTRFLE